MLSSALWIWLSSLAFALLHSGMAARACKLRLQRMGVGPQRYRLVYSIVAVLTTAAWFGFVHMLPDAPWYRVTGWPAWLLIAVQLLGLGIAVASLRAFDARMFLGLAPMPETGEPFYERGIYRFLRHPMYAGAMLALIASPVQSVTSANLIAAVCLYLVLGSKLEEARMQAAHPEYADYRRRVGAFVPKKGIPKGMAKCRRAG
ncbi:MAG TPA: NnrU family protein [Mariprofundaceae bacterium]|nr:NnrU family protein [Mariprofundaceae bacterium]